MSLTEQQKNNVRQWISEYPDLKWVFESPEFVSMFAGMEPPREDTKEWLATVEQLAQEFG